MVMKKKPPYSKRGGSRRRQAFSKFQVNQLIWGTLKTLITKFSKDPNNRVKSGKYKGDSVKDLEKKRDEILKRRGQLPEATTSLLDDDSWEKEIKGSGLGASDGDKLIHRLYVSLGSIRAGNTSTKLRKQVADLLQLFTKHGVINKYQRRKIFNDYTVQRNTTFCLIRASQSCRLE